MSFRSPFEQLLKKSRGKPFAFDNDGMRSLHFDEKYIQSAMWIAEPDKLLLSYTRAMMGFLLFEPEPVHILQIGLGGGSLVKYCYRHLPSTRIAALELDADVIALRDDFMIPTDDARFKIIHTDAVQYLHQQPDYGSDVILLDAYSAEGPAPELSSAAFYADCLRCLTPDGILVANLWEHPASFAAKIMPDALHDECLLWWSRTYDSHNFIAFFVKGRNKSVFRSVLAARAKKLDGEYELGLADLVGELQIFSKTHSRG